jgi:beta-lactam-binding protein with PASTA domain
VTAVGGEAASDSELSVSTITLPARAAPRPVARSCQVPDVRGLSLRDAVHLLHQAGLRVELAGFGRAIATLPEAGSIVPTGTLVRLTGSDGP